MAGRAHIKTTPIEQEMKTYWNGEPCKAEFVMVRVGKSDRPTWWCAPLEGQTRSAIRITSGGGKPFFIDNEDGTGFEKITKGQGSPTWPHSSLPDCSEVVEL